MWGRRDDHREELAEVNQLLLESTESAAKYRVLAERFSELLERATTNGKRAVVAVTWMPLFSFLEGVGITLRVLRRGAPWGLVCQAVAIVGLSILVLWLKTAGTERAGALGSAWRRNVDTLKSSVLVIAIGVLVAVLQVMLTR